MAQVVLETVTKRYPGDVLAVRSLDLSIRDGELVVLVGPSGCGKSTTLRMVAGLEEISEGELRIGDRRVNEVAPKDRDIAMVFQSYALYPHMSVFENMAFGLRLKRTPSAEVQERVRAAAATLGIVDLLGRKPKALSGGQRQRVAMGRAMVREPAVFLFDEPLSNLDAKLRVQMRVEIARLHSRLASTMLYVTHDQVEAMTLADRIAVMSVGLLQQLGTPMEVYHRPANRFVAGFVGSPAMNFLDGRIEGRAFVGGGLRLELPAAHLDRLAAAPLGALTLGLRPQLFTPVETGEAAALRGRVDFVERMGAESFAHLDVEGGELLVARLDGDTPVAAGDVLELGCDAGRAHVFDAEGINLVAELAPMPSSSQDSSP